MQDQKNTPLAKNRIEIVTELSDTFFAEWKQLWDSSNNSHFFNSPMWFKVCDTTYHYDSYVLVAQYTNDTLFSVVPLVSTKKFGVSVLTTPNFSFSDMSPLLINEYNPKLVKQLSTFLTSLKNVIIPEIDQDLAHLLSSDDTATIHTSDSPFMQLTEAFGGLSKKSAKRIRTKIRSNGDQFKFIFQEKVSDRDIATITNIEEASYKADELKNIFSDNTNQDLFKNLIAIAPEYLGVAYYTHGNKKCISDFYSFGKNTAHSMHSTYRKEYSHLWPGTVLQYKILEYFAQTKNLSMLDMGRGINVVKLKFASDVRKQFTVYIVPNIVKRTWLITAAHIEQYLHTLKNKYSFLAAGLIVVKKLKKRI